MPSKTLKESHIDMPLCPDVTEDPEWGLAQFDRLLGFEVLQAAISADPTPIEPAVLADKLGVYKGYPYAILRGIRSKLSNGQ